MSSKHSKVSKSRFNLGSGSGSGSSILATKYNTDTPLKILCSLIIILLICILIGNYAFKSGILTCDHYVLNTYLYVMLAFLLMYLMVLLNDKFGIFNPVLEMLGSMGFFGFIILLVIIVGLMYLLNKTPADELIKSNLLWLCLLVFVGILIIPIIYFGRIMNVNNIAGYFTLAIIIITGLLGYYLGDKIITFDWDYYLHIALISLIVFGILGSVYIGINNSDAQTIIYFIYIVSILSLILFTLLLLSNQKKLKEHAEKCIDGQVIPNYPLESLSIVIKIYNIFIDIVRILGIRKMRSGGKFRR